MDNRDAILELLGVPEKGDVSVEALRRYGEVLAEIQTLMSVVADMRAAAVAEANLGSSYRVAAALGIGETVARDILHRASGKPRSRNHRSRKAPAE